MRGKADELPPHVGGYGITPAYAGKRGGENCIEKPLGDHPRVCGEKGIQGTVGSFSQGSPPRMRGKVQHPAP